MVQPMLRIAIADDHAIVRKGLRQIIADTHDLIVAGEAANADELLTLLRSQPFDLVVLDLSLGDRSGLEVLKHIKSEFPKLRVLVLSMHHESIFGARVLQAGGSGYIQKESAPEELLRAIRRIVAGGIYVSDAMSQQLATEIVRGGTARLPHEHLSDREFEIFLLLGSGKSVTDIARQLNLSVKTVSTHRTRILAKTGFSSNEDIVRYVAAHHLS
jgi:two-component system invasion response regulator UvrY